MKKCIRCEIEFELEMFPKDRHRKDGKHPYCKKCVSARRNKENEKRWHRENSERIKAVKKAFRSTDEYKARNNKAMRDKRNGDPVYRLHQNISRRIRYSLNKGGRATWSLVTSYSLEDLKKHLESKFQPGMSWDNYGMHGWHIDHIIPLSHFEITSAECEAFKKCWALENLQPLWAADNLRKNNRLTYTISTPTDP